MTIDLQANQKNLYDRDFVGWIETTVEQLCAQNYADVDWTNLIEEIEDMSRRGRKSLKSNLVGLLLHLLKWQYQPEYRSGSWRGSIREQRRHQRRFARFTKLDFLLASSLGGLLYQCVRT
jgi:Domain of unknown function DUF29